MPDDLPAVQLPPQDRWQNLGNGPRSVPLFIRIRLALYQLTLGVHFALIFAAICAIVGFGFLVPFSGDPQSDGPPVFIIIGALPLLIGICVGIGIAILLLERSAPYVSALQNGKLARGKITHLYDHCRGRIVPWNQLLKEWQEFVASGTSRLAASNRANALTRFRLEPEEDELDLEAEIDMGGRAVRADADPWITMVYHQGYAIDAEQFPWLGVDHRGRWRYALIHEGTRTGTENSLVQALLVVVPSFLIATLYPWATGEAANFPDSYADTVPKQIMAVLIAWMFTWTHAVIPAFVFGSIIAHGRDAGGTFGHFLFLLFISVAATFWFTAPIVIMTGQYGWQPLIWFGLHILLARRGTKRWLFVEYASTSLALVLYSELAADPIPFGLIAIAGQIFLLTFMNMKARPIWTTPKPA